MSKTILILGDSPTLTDISSHIPALLEKYESISINRTKYKCTYTIGNDRRTWEGIADKIKRGELPADFSKWVVPAKAKDLDIPFYTVYWRDDDIDADRDNMFYPGYNSLVPALNLALVEGATRVVIIACELMIGSVHSSDPGRLFNSPNWGMKSQVIKDVVNQYKSHFELFQIVKPEHLLDLPVVTPQYVLENF